ncbi:predicted protein [Histoplasma mississippiense (nom. inval.)]|uniref:predicted protein n=1 Tax=Ajellomyces capsulatus (strain NAm1 / WU24) TaxID=2059318 RepID=UPI000157B86D|nr:predicted protein [Histoplasma mississippiense (nom. inval.)]EDN03275.1 predicted protein [Histoplasma mississippiense (nom. inval.)]
MAEAQDKYQHQFQSQSPPFPTQEWVQFFPSPSPKSPAGTAITTTSSAKEDEKVKYMISTDPSLLSLSALDSAFTQEYMYWVKPLPAPVLKDMIDRSLCFGVTHSLLASIPSVERGSAPNTSAKTGPSNHTPRSRIFVLPYWFALVETGAAARTHHLRSQIIQNLANDESQYSRETHIK